MEKANFLALAIGVAALLGASQAWAAATQSVTANIAFDIPLTLTKFEDINFGTMTAANASTYRMYAATGSITTVAGTGAYLYGVFNVGGINIVGPAADTLAISVGGYTANNGVTPSNASCTYDFGASVTPCSYAAAAAPGGGGKILILGVDVTTDGTQAAGTTAAPTFTVTVVAN